MLQKAFLKIIRHEILHTHTHTHNDYICVVCIYVNNHIICFHFICDEYPNDVAIDFVIGYAIDLRAAFAVVAYEMYHSHLPP